MHPSYALSDFMRELKGSSSKWLKRNSNFPYFEDWGESFTAFTYNLSDRDTVINYIRKQKEHHKSISFEEKYRQILVENRVEVDEKFFLKD